MHPLSESQGLRRLLREWTRVVLLLCSPQWPLLPVLFRLTGVRFLRRLFEALIWQIASLRLTVLARAFHR
jgi:hypothetical protein